MKGKAHSIAEAEMGAGLFAIDGNWIITVVSFLSIVDVNIPRASW